MRGGDEGFLIVELDNDGGAEKNGGKDNSQEH